MKDNAVSLRTRELTAAVDALHGTLRERLPVPAPDPRGYVADLARFPALRMALRFCVDVRAPGDVDGLASLVKRVPEKYVDRERRVVRCLCGEEVAWGDLRECGGGCGRWFAVDESGAYAARLESEDVDG